jgi:hypothetical protein
MEMKDQIIDDEDGFDDEAEARERYPFLFSDSEGGSGVADGADVLGGDDVAAEEPEKTRDTLLRSLESFGIGSGMNSDGLPNYHYLDSLSEDHLPHLDFRRSDNFFGGKPAHRFFKNSGKTERNSARLFGDYWLEGELAILFSDVGAGKSILAAQLAQAIASGCPIEPFGADTPPQRVAFFDLELSDDQFDSRYSHDDAEHPAKFPFHKNFIRNTPSRYAVIPDWAADESHFILNSIIGFLEFSKARVAIIDNISWLNTGINVGVSEPRFLRAFSRIRREMGLSILVLAHTPKSRFRSPLSVNDLRGSKMLASFADSIFALGGSRLGQNIRYLKSIKRRSAPATERDKVVTLKIEKDVCFLGMNFEGFSDERDHIGWMSNKVELEKLAVMEKLMGMDEENIPQREMANRLGISQSTVCRYLKFVAEHNGDSG